MADCLKHFEEEIVACLSSADPERLAEDLLEHGLLAQADFNTFGPYASHTELIRYLLIHVYKQLQAQRRTTGGPALFERCLEVLSNHDVSDELLDHVRHKYSSSNASGGDSQVLMPGFSIARGKAKSTTGMPLNEPIYDSKHVVSGVKWGPTLEEDLSDQRVIPVQSCSAPVLPTGEPMSHTQGRSSECEGGSSAMLHLRAEHVPLLMSILAAYAYKWNDIGIALNLPPNFLIGLRAPMHYNSMEVLLHLVLYEWVSGQHVDGKKPTLVNLKSALGGGVVKLGNLAYKLEQRFIIEGGVHKQDAAGPLNTVKSSQPIQDWRYRSPSGPHGPPSASKMLGGFPAYLDYSTAIDEWEKVLTDIYLAQPELPADSWPPVSHGTFINLALIKQGNIRDSQYYARYTIQEDMDDVLKDKERIEYECVFNDLSSGARLLIEGRPGSGKTTLVHKVSRDWAKEELLLNDVQLLFLVHLRHFFSDPSITLCDIIKYHFQESTAEKIVKYAESCSGEGLCFILDGLDEYTPKTHSNMPANNNVIFKLIQKDILPRALVIVASRPSALANFRKKATKRIETLGFLKGEIFKYVNEYEFSDDDKTEGLLSYLDLHPNVMHMCYLPIHTAMVCFLYDEMGNALPRTETKMYDNFTCHTLLRTLYREEQRICLQSVEDLPYDKKQLFAQICELAFEKTKLSLQVIRGSEIRFSKNISTSKDSLGLITLDRMASLVGKDALYTFLHLTFQEYLAAYHIAHNIPEEEQLELLDKYGKEENMQVVWKFFCGLVKFNNQSSKFDQLVKSADDDLFKVQCAFESQQPDTCDRVVLSGSSGQLSFQNKVLNPTDFTAIGYVLKHVRCPSAVELVLKECKFGEEGIAALHTEAEDNLHLLRTVRYHGGDCSREQFRVAITLLQHIPHIQTLDITDTIIGTAKTKLFADMLTLPELQVFELSGNQYNTKILKMLGKVSGSKFQCIRFDPPTYVPFTGDSNYLAVHKELGLPVLIHSIHHFPSINLLGHELGYSEVLILSDDLSRCVHLILPGCKLGDEEAKVLGHALKNACKLETLNIAFNCITDTGANAIADDLSYCTNLKELNISCNQIGDVGALAIAEATKGILDLKCFIWNDNITESGAEILQSTYDLAGSIAHTIDCTGLTIEESEIPLCASNLRNSLKSFSELRKLRLNVAKNVSCLAGIKLPHLQSLTLEGEQCTIGADGAKALAKSLKHCRSLHSLHLNENRICADGAIALAEGLKYCNSLHTLHLSGNGIGTDGAKALARLRNCSLHTLHMSGNGIGADGAIAIATLLMHCNGLLTLHMSGNGIGADGTRALAKSLKNSNKLRTIHLSDNGIGADGAEALADTLKHCNSLHTLHLSGNGIGAAGTKAIVESLKHCKNLHTLLLDEDRVDADGTEALAESLRYWHSLHILHLNRNNEIDANAFAAGLKYCNNLHTLYLGWNEIGPDGVATLALDLKHCNNLHTLHLGWNVIGDDGAKALAEGLKQCNSLHTLNLDSNEIGADGAKALAEGLKYYSSLHTLHFGWNEIGNDGAKALAEGLKQCNSLHSLHLNCNGIHADGAMALAESLKYCKSLHTLLMNDNELGADGAKALAEGLKQCNGLHTLHMDRNGIGADGVKALGEYLKHFNSLCNLQLSGNNLGVDGAELLAAGLKHCSNLRILHLNKNSIGDGGVTVLVKNLKHLKCLHTLQLSENKIGAAGARALTEILLCNSLHTLHFSGNAIYARATELLAEGLKHCSNLHTLQLSGLETGPDGAIALAGSLKHCSSLHTLDLSFNGINHGGAEALAEGLKHCKHLHTLNLSSNKITLLNAQVLAEGLKQCKNLHTLDLSRNRISAKMLVEYCNGLHTLNLSSNGIGYGAEALADGLKHCHGLHILDLSRNEIDTDGAKAIVTSLKKSLHTLDLSSNQIDVMFLAEYLKHCTSLHTLDLSSNCQMSTENLNFLAEDLELFCNSLHTLRLDCLLNHHNIMMRPFKLRDMFQQLVGHLDPDHLSTELLSNQLIGHFDQTNSRFAELLSSLYKHRPYQSRNTSRENWLKHGLNTPGRCSKIKPYNTKKPSR